LLYKSRAAPGEDGEAVYADPLNQVLMMDMRLYLENDILSSSIARR